MCPYIEGMRKTLFTLVATCLLAFPVTAQETTPDPDPVPDNDQGFDLMEEGARLLLRGLLSEMDPAIEELRDLADEVGPKMQYFAQEMGPAFTQLLQQVDDFANYAPPEFLPNGDIIIRRRDTAPEFIPHVDNDTGDVEL